MTAMEYTVKTAIICCVYFMALLRAEQITYVSVEHPAIVYLNKKYVSDANMTAFRYGRSSPIYYVTINFTVEVPVGNNIQVDFYFYQFLSNRYQRSFVEMHFKFCDLIHKDMFFGAAMKQGKLDAPCPYPPDTYYLTNMTILPEAIPNGFPFTKGRIYCNMTYLPTKELAVHGYIDMELKTFKLRNRKKNNRL